MVTMMFPFASHLRRPCLLSRHEAALVVITMIWGVTFLVVQNALTVTGPLFFVGTRFAVAGLLIGALSLPALRGLTLAEVGAGLAIGVGIFFGYALQTVGLETIPSSKSAFITAFYVPLVPLLQWVAFRRPVGTMAWVGVALAFAGLLLLAGPDGMAAFGLGKGEVLTVVSALSIAVEIVLIGFFAGTVDLRRVTAVQLCAASLFSFVAMPVVGEGIPAVTGLLVASAGGLGVSSALIQLTMNWAQKEVAPTRAAVIYAGEPVWAGVVGRIAGERLPALALVGAVLIVAGVVVGEIRPRRGSGNGDAKPQPALP